MLSFNYDFKIKVGKTPPCPPAVGLLCLEREELCWDPTLPHPPIPNGKGDGVGPVCPTGNRWGWRWDGGNTAGCCWQLGAAVLNGRGETWGCPSTPMLGRKPGAVPPAWSSSREWEQPHPCSRNTVGSVGQDGAVSRAGSLRGHPGSGDFLADAGRGLRVSRGRAATRQNRSALC